MQELISQIAALGIEITPTRSLMIIFGIILFTAVVVHLILHKVVLRAFEKTGAGQQPGCKSSRRINSFTDWPFTLQGIIVNVQAVLWLQKGSEAAEILTTVAQLWVMIYAMLSFFSLLDVILKLAQKFPAASQLLRRHILQELLDGDYYRYSDYFATDASVIMILISAWLPARGCGADAGV